MASKAARPGSGIRNAKADKFVTLGAYGLTTDRKVRGVFSAHGIAYFPGGEGARGDPIVGVRRPGKIQAAGESARLILDGEEFSIQGVNLSSFRIFGIGEDLPAVLKAPAKAARGARVIKSGAATGVTSGQVIETKCEVKVKYDDRTAKFVDQIRTTKMAKRGDSGSLLLTADSFQPLGLLVATSKTSTYFCKLTNVPKELDLLGVFCPLSLPSGSPPVLRHLADLLIWDGLYMQKNKLNVKDPEKILKGLGVVDIQETSEGRWNAVFRGAFVVSMPFVKSDPGNILTDKDNRAVGVIVSGSEKGCVAIPMKKVLKAFSLSLL